MAASKVPSAWDEEDWEKLADKTTAAPPLVARRPNPAAPAFNPPSAPRLLRPSAPEFDHTASLIYTPSAGGVPKTLYKPELKILKRFSPDATEAPAAIVSSSSSPADETDKERRERERKEKERRYKEARDRIMGDTSTTTTPPPPQTQSDTTATPKSKKHNQNNKRSPDRAPKSTPSRTASSTPTTRSPSTSRKPSPPRGGAITSLSLNGGDFTAPAPVPQRYYSHQRELDEKLLESQLPPRASSSNAHITPETDAAGLDWDSFSRDAGWPRQQPPAWNGGGYYQAGVDYGYATAAGVPGYDYQGYEYAPQFTARVQNPAIYGAAAAEMPAARYAYGQSGGYMEKGGYAEKGYADKGYAEKTTRGPGGGQVGVVQAVREPRGPDADGGRGFRGRGRGSGGGEGLVEGVKGMRIQG